MCPVCGAPLSSDPATRCAHVVAWMGPRGFCSPLDGVALPWLTGPDAWRRWPVRTIAEAFGQLAPLIDAYGAVADWRPGMSARVLWPLLAEFVDEEVATVTVPRGELAETYWCTADPAEVSADARAIAALLGQGFDYLRAHADRALMTARAATDAA